MTLSLRQRLVLTLLPLLIVLVLLGTAAMVLLHRLGGRINDILKENYESVIAMERLNEALERIDSSFQFALAGEEQKAREQYDTNWVLYHKMLQKEADNITIHPTEDELVERLREGTARYRRQGQDFFARPARDAARRDDYFERPGLYDTFKEVKKVAEDIRVLNQDNMVQASRAAQETARASLIGFGVGLAAAVVLAVLLAWRTLHAILTPLRAVTLSAQAIGAGNLDQVVPVQSRDELGQLADAFNAMARQLRHYRQSDYARLLRVQRTSQATIDSFPDPVLVVNAQGEVEMANPAAGRLLGVAAPPTDRAAPLRWRPPEPLAAPLAEALRDQRPYLPETFERAVPLPADGQDRFVLPRVLPIRDAAGATLGAAVLLQDVTRFRLLDRVKSDLVATVSHELKTPLTSVRLAVHLLLEEAAGPLTPKQLELLVDARDNAERLLAMIDHLLDLARLEQGTERLQLRPESAAALLRAAADAARPRADDKAITLAVEVPDDLPPVAADRERLQHALDNLLDNAVRYTDRGGKVTLAAAAAGDTVVLTVADTGRGIPPEYLPQVFERFFRVPGQSSEGGTGLGLAIVREVVAAHGGTVTCDSRPGAGTVFRLTLQAWRGEGGGKP